MGSYCSICTVSPRQLLLIHKLISAPKLHLWFAAIQVFLPHLLGLPVDMLFLARTRGAYDDVHWPLNKLVYSKRDIPARDPQQDISSKSGISPGPQLAGTCGGLTYKWQAAVCAHANLRFVGVDKYSGMPQWSATSITLNNSVVCPSYWLLVNQGDSGLWSRLHRVSKIQRDQLH